MDHFKEKVAKAALTYLKNVEVVGVGTGSTVNYFIEQLATQKSSIEACIASSKETEKRLKALGLPVVDLNTVDRLPIYIDGADEVNNHGQMIKGGGGALTREKIIATVAQQFICIVDETKLVSRLGHFPLAVEVIPIARSFVAREIVKLGGDPEYRENFLSDNGNIILDVHNLDILEPMRLEEKIKLIPGVVENGLFAKRIADKVLIGNESGVKCLEVK